MLKRMLGNGRSGFYFSVVQQGMVQAGDEITKVHEDPEKITIADFNRLYRDGGGQNADLLRRAASLAIVPENWRSYFLEGLKSLERAS
jgi:MOSC domain-containing protein YiiM